MSEQTAGERRSIKFDGTISLGTLITVTSIIAGGIWFAAQSDSKLKSIDGTLHEVKGSIERLSIQTNNNIERIDRRIDNMIRQRP